MPQAALPAIGLGLGGVSLLDQLFGSGAQARDQQQQGLDLQQQLAEAQLPDIQRRTDLNQQLQQILMGMFNDPQVPEQWLNLDDKDQTGLYNSVAPGVMANSALNKLFGLGGNVGTGGIQGFANLSTGLGEQRRGEFQDTIGQLVQSLLMNNSPDTPMVAPTGAPPGSGPYLDPRYPNYLGGPWSAFGTG